jgi:NTP pyrophosphatase (non-canonical NTP hydrolase)
MDFNTYQQQAATTAVYPESAKYIYPTLGLCGEAGEVAEKIKKVIRDNGGVFTEEKKKEIVKEVGDVLWYIAALLSDLDVTMDEAAIGNLEKLFSRKERGVINGNGDNR